MRESLCRLWVGEKVKEKGAPLPRVGGAGCEWYNLLKSSASSQGSSWTNQPVQESVQTMGRCRIMTCSMKEADHHCSVGGGTCLQRIPALL